MVKSDVEKVMKLYLQRFFTSLSTYDMFFFEQTHSKLFISYFLPKKNSTRLYKDKIFTHSNNIYSMSTMQ